MGFKEKIEKLAEALDALKKSFGPGVDTGESFQMSTEEIKFDKCGQWKIEKSTLDYSKWTKPKRDYDKIEREAHGLKYSNGNTKVEAIKPQVDSKPDTKVEAAPAKPTPAKPIKTSTSVKPGKTALETMRSRGQVKGDIKD